MLRTYYLKVSIVFKCQLLSQCQLFTANWDLRLTKKLLVITLKGGIRFLVLGTWQLLEN